MSNKLNEYNYLIAYNLISKELKIISTIEKPDNDNLSFPKNNNKDNFEIILHSEIINPEDLLIKKNLYNSLSEEAKELLQIIINSPKELFELLLLTPRKKILSINKFKKIISKHWNSKFFVEMTFKEIKKWLKELN